MTDLEGDAQLPTPGRGEGIPASLRVLLVERDAATSGGLGALLAGWPDWRLEVVPAADLRSALDRLSRSPRPDVVLLDLDLPDSRGLATAMALIERAPGLPVVALAEERNQAEAWRATRHGVRHVVLRERTPGEIAWTLLQALEQQQLHLSLDRHIRELELTNGRFLSLVVDNADAMVVIDRAGIMRFVNPSAERLLQCSAADLLGQRFAVPLEPGETRELELPTELGLSGAGGDTQTAELRAMPTLWDGERAIIVTMRDITERKRNELALKIAMRTAERASAMKSQFLANMSHELRTPLNAIIGYSELMLMGIAGPLQPEKYRSYLQDIKRGGTHLLALINDLLDLSKAESGMLELNEVAVDLVALAESTVKLMTGEALSKGLNLNLAAETRSICIRADERMVTQILLNLLSNALNFTPEGGSVTVAVNRSFDGEARLVVRDTGVGMPRSEIPRAFAAFVQIENAYRRARNSGAGLGLALTKRFVDLHSGRITLDSKEQVGTVVTVAFPAERALPSRDAGPSLPVEQAARRGEGG